MLAQHHRDGDGIGETGFRQRGAWVFAFVDQADSVVGCAIVRDADGLALSSRNVLLGDDARARALALSRAVAAVAAAPAPASEHRQRLREVLDAADLEVVYAEVVDPVTFAPSTDAESGDARALVAAFVDGVRLIDNGPVVLKGEQ